MNVSIEAMTGAVDSTFVAHTAAGEIALTLVSVQEGARHGLPEQFRTPLTLVLTGPATPVLYDDHYFLDHPVLGRNQWFMTPLLTPPALPDGQPARQRYQVMFS